jgi:hypothetical protein
VAGPQFGANPLIELRRQYDEWRQQNIPDPEDSSIDPILLAMAIVVLLVLVALAITRGQRQR